MNLTRRLFTKQGLLVGGAIAGTGIATKEVLDNKEEKLTETAIDYIIEHSLQKPNLHSIERIPFFRVQKEFKKNGGYRYRYPDPHQLPTVDLMSYSKGMEYSVERGVTPIVTARLEHDRFEISYSTKDCFENFQASMRSGKNKRLNDSKDLRINNTTTQMFLLHPEERKFPDVWDLMHRLHLRNPNGKQAEIYQKAFYNNGEIEDLEEPSERVLKLMERATIKAAKKCGVKKADEMYYYSKEQYLQAEKKMMENFAKEYNPKFTATKINQWPGGWFQKVEVGKMVGLYIPDSLILRDNNTGKNSYPFPDLAVYLKIGIGHLGDINPWIGKSIDVLIS